MILLLCQQGLLPSHTALALTFAAQGLKETTPQRTVKEGVSSKTKGKTEAQPKEVHSSPLLKRLAHAAKFHHHYSTLLYLLYINTGRSV